MSETISETVTKAFEAVHVHIASTAVPLGQAPAPAPARKTRRTSFHTVALTADDPAQQILPASGKRIHAYVQALDDDVTLALTEGDAAKLSGSVLPKANTAPWLVEHDGAVFAAASSFSSANSTARVSVTAVYEA